MSLRFPYADAAQSYSSLPESLLEIRKAMMDIVFVGLVCVLLGMTVGLIRVCERV